MSGQLGGDPVTLRASTLPVGANNRASTLSAEGDVEGKKKKKGLLGGSFLKKKKDKS